MAKLEAVEALKSEKAEKEVRLSYGWLTGPRLTCQLYLFSESCNDCPRPVVLRVTRSCVSVRPVVLTCRCWTRIVDLPIISVVKYVYCSKRKGNGLTHSLPLQMHLGYHELRKLIETFNEQRQAARMSMNGPRPMGGPAPAAPSAPRGPMAPPPSGPSAPRMGGPPMNNGFMAPPPPVDQPMTPTGQIGLPVDPEREADSAFPGHGDKKRREAMELQQDSRHERSRDDDR